MEKEENNSVINDKLKILSDHPLEKKNESIMFEDDNFIELSESLRRGRIMEKRLV